MTNKTDALVTDADRELYAAIILELLGDKGLAQAAREGVDDGDAALSLIVNHRLSTRPANGACVGCEGKPSAENNPCAVCGANAVQGDAGMRDIITKRRAIYIAKRDKAASIGDHWERHERMSHTVEAFDMLLDEIDAALQPKDQSDVG